MWRRRLHVIPGLVAVGILVSALVSTESRGPLLAAIVAIVVFLVASNPRVSETTLAFFCLASAFLIGFLYIFPNVIPDRVAESLFSPADAVDSSMRTDLWAETWPVISDNPLGVGYGNWAVESGTVGFMWPHNLFLEVFAEAGWIAGAVIVGATLWVVVKLAGRARRDPYASLVLMLLAASIVEVSVSGDINARTFFALLTLGFVLSTWPPQRQDADRAPAPEGETSVGTYGHR